MGSDPDPIKRNTDLAALFCSLSFSFSTLTPHQAFICPKNLDHVSIVSRYVKRTRLLVHTVQISLQDQIPYKKVFFSLWNKLTVIFIFIKITRWYFTSGRQMKRRKTNICISAVVLYYSYISATETIFKEGVYTGSCPYIWIIM